MLGTPAFPTGLLTATLVVVIMGAQPVLEIALILVGAYLATLLTTYLPSRAASRVAPAEALRYE